MDKYMIDLLLKLVSIDTTSETRKNFDIMSNLILEEAEKIGLEAHKVVDDNRIPHVIINLAKRTGGKKIVFVAHYDVVPAGEGWDFDPFKPFIKDGKIFGRGASDDKSGIVTALAAFKEINESKLEIPNDVTLVVAGGEETGAAAGFFEKIEGDVAVILDVGPEGLSIGASGVVRAKVTVYGIQGHSAYPFRAQNAIYNATRLINFIEAWGRELETKRLSSFHAPEYYDRLPARMNVTIIKGGIAGNVIPSEVELIIDRRTIPEENAEDVAKELKERIEEFSKASGFAKPAEVEILGTMNAWVTNDEYVINCFRKIVSEIIGSEPKLVVELGGTDGIHFIERMPVIQFGALRSDTNIHGKNEFVYIKDLEIVKQFVKKVSLSKL